MALKAFSKLRRGELSTITGRTPRAWQLEGPEPGTCTYLTFEVRPSATPGWRDRTDEVSKPLRDKVANRQIRAAASTKAFRRKAQEKAIESAQVEALMEAHEEEQAKPLEQRRTETQATYDAIREHLLVGVELCTGPAEEDDITPAIEAYGEAEDEAAAAKELENALSPAALLAPADVPPASSRKLSDDEIAELLRARFVDDIEDPDVEIAPHTWPYAGFLFGGRAPATPGSPRKPVCDLIATIIQDLAGLATEGHRWEQRQAVEAAKKAPTGGLGAAQSTPTPEKSSSGSSKRGSASAPNAGSPSTGRPSVGPERVSASTTAAPAAPSAPN